MSNIPVIYEDNWIVIVDKPSGLLTVPTPKKEARTLVSVLNQEQFKDGPRLHPCHRLDRETSGLLVLAKSGQARDRVMALFKERKVRKSYLALVRGNLSGPGRISLPIDGKPASTRYHALRARGDFSVVRVFPETGRTNQIRIHFKHLGHPVLGERVYAFRKDFKVKAKRLMLHAETLEFTHPFTGRPLRVSAPVPPDMRRLEEAGG